ncbi:MAG: hypothetical protein IJ193_02685 [Bacilli bacterium]|nr:hypothetical protein [Bacilli bacterium]
MEKIVEETLKKYDTRDGKAEEESLFGFLYYAILDENFNEISYQRMWDATDRFARVKRVLRNSEAKNNIYVEKCKEFLLDSKEECADILVSTTADSVNVRKVYQNDSLLPMVEDDGSEEVKRYNAINKQLEMMFCEIYRMRIWEAIERSGGKDDIQVCILERYKDDPRISVISKFKKEPSKRYTLKRPSFDN